METPTHVIGIESKRFEPFRLKSDASLSEAYWRPVWGNAMAGYQHLRDGLRNGTVRFARLDAVQLVKHAFGLRTAVHRNPSWQGRKPVLFYIYAEPAHWPDGRSIPNADLERHRSEIKQFKSVIAGDEVSFHMCSYREFLSAWADSPVPAVREHAGAVTACFAP